MYRTYGARDFACYLFPALAGWANVWRTYGAFGRGWPARRTRGAKKDAGLPDTRRRDPRQGQPGHRRRAPQFGGPSTSLRIKKPLRGSGQAGATRAVEKIKIE